MGMALEVGPSYEAVKVNKRVRDRQIQNLPDYLRFVARKSKAGFDKVHDELTKIYSTEKKLQRQKMSTDSEVPLASPSRETKARTTTIDIRSANKPVQRTSNRLSLRKQWTRGVKANTMWLSTGSNIPEEGTFISYISEEIESNSEQSRRKISVEQLKEELKPRSHSSEEDTSTVHKLESNFKSLSANQVRKDKSVFTFDTLRASRSFEALSDQGDEQCHDYMNIKDYRHHQQNTGKTNAKSYDDYDVPKASQKSPVKTRNEIKAKPQTRNKVNDKPDNVPSTCGKSTDRMYVNESNHDGTLNDDDYLQMDDVKTLVSGKCKLEKEQIVREEHTSDMPSDGLGDSCDYVLPDTCKPNHAFEKQSLYTQLKHNQGEEDDYLQMDDVKTLVSEKDKLEEEHIIREEHSSDMPSDGLGDSSDYVLPDTCKPDHAFEKQSLYTQLKQNQGDNVYATVNKKTHEENNRERNDDIYANSTSVLYDDFDNLTENDVLPEDSDRVYDFLPSPKPVKQRSNNATKLMHSSDDSNKHVKDFYEFSLSELVECLNACALPRLASICEDEHLDGHFFENFDESDLIKEPFSLNWFHIAKLRRVISGWRPKR